MDASAQRNLLAQLRADFANRFDEKIGSKDEQWAYFLCARFEELLLNIRMLLGVCETPDQIAEMGARALLLGEQLQKVSLTSSVLPESYKESVEYLSVVLHDCINEHRFDGDLPHLYFLVLTIKAWLGVLLNRYPASIPLIESTGMHKATIRKLASDVGDRGMAGSFDPLKSIAENLSVLEASVARAAWRK